MAFVLSMALVGWHASPAQAVSLNELFAGQEHFRYDGVNTNGVGGYIYATAIANMNSTSDHIDEFVRLSCNCSDPGYDFDTVWVQAGRVQGALDATHNYPHSTPMYYEYNWCQDGTIGSGYGIVPIGNPGTADYPEWIYYYPATVQKTCNNTVITVQKFAIATGTMSNIVGYGLYHYFAAHKRLVRRRRIKRLPTARRVKLSVSEPTGGAWTQVEIREPPIDLFLTVTEAGQHGIIRPALARTT